MFYWPLNVLQHFEIWKRAVGTCSSNHCTCLAPRSFNTDTNKKWVLAVCKRQYTAVTLPMCWNDSETNNLQLSVEDVITRPMPFDVNLESDPWGGFTYERRLLPPMSFGKKQSDATVKVSRATHVAVLECGKEHVYWVIWERKTRYSLVFALLLTLRDAWGGGSRGERVVRDLEILLIN